MTLLGVKLIEKVVVKLVRLGRIADSTEEKRFTREKKKETKVHNIKGNYKGERKNYQNKDI